MLQGMHLQLKKAVIIIVYDFQQVMFRLHVPILLWSVDRYDI